MLETLCDHLVATIAITLSGIFIIAVIVIVADSVTTAGYSYIDMGGKSGKADYCSIRRNVLSCTSGNKIFMVREFTKLKEEE